MAPRALRLMRVVLSMLMATRALHIMRVVLSLPIAPRPLRIVTVALSLPVATAMLALVAGCGPKDSDPGDGAGAISSEAEVVTPARADQQLEAKVMVEVFSGRPNPEWTLTPEQSDELSQRMGFLTPTAAEPPPLGLGYRGVVVRVDATNAVGAASLRAYGETVFYTIDDLVTGVPSTTPLHDAGGMMETWLLSTGEPHMDAATYAEIAAVVEAARAEEVGQDAEGVTGGGSGGEGGSGDDGGAGGPDETVVAPTP